ncbi:MAG: PaaI family thioesterase [Promethearchaeota archaeon]
MLDKKIAENSMQRLRWYNNIKEKELKEASVPPFSKWCSGRLTYIKRGEIEIKYDTQPEMDNSTGLLHGGMICAMIDNTIGYAAYGLGYETGVITIGIQVSFLGKIEIGEKVRIKAKILREGKYLLHAIAQVFNSSGEIVSLANSDLLLTTSYVDFHKFRKNIIK